jgi:hypothetical protein
MRYQITGVRAPVTAVHTTRSARNAAAARYTTADPAADGPLKRRNEDDQQAHEDVGEAFGDPLHDEDAAVVDRQGTER